MTTNKAELALNAIGGALLAWWLGLDDVYHAFMALMALDLVSGLLASILQGQKWHSEIMFRGLMKKAMAIIVVLTASALVPIVPSDQATLLAQYVAGFFCCWEALSILENAGNAGLPLPKRLTGLLSALSPEPMPEPTLVATFPPHEQGP